jgi:hypothetical protein
MSLSSRQYPQKLVNLVSHRTPSNTNTLSDRVSSRGDQDWIVQLIKMQHD